MNNKCQILLFIETLECGGAEKSLVSLLQLIDYSKVQVDLMLLRDGGLFRSYVPEEVNVILIPKPMGIRKIWHKVSMGTLSVALRLGLMRGRHGAEKRWIFEGCSLPKLDKYYDVAIAYQQGFPTFYIPSKVNATKRIAWVNTDLISAGYNMAFCGKYYTLYDNVVAVSEKLYHNLLKSDIIDNRKLTTVYDILNVDLIRKMAQEGVKVPERLSKTLRIVTIGRMTHAKNYPLAVETAAELKKRGIKFQWILVGGGTELPHVKSLIDKYGLGDVVIPVGVQANPYPYMAWADLYVHTARFEGFGLTIAEAKILGKPVVSTNFTVVYDQITDGVNGLIAEMNPQSVADAIERIVRDEELKERLTDAVTKEENTTSKTEIGKFMKLINF